MVLQSFFPRVPIQIHSLSFSNCPLAIESVIFEHRGFISRADFSLVLCEICANLEKKANPLFDVYQRQTSFGVLYFDKDLFGWSQEKSSLASVVNIE